MESNVTYSSRQGPHEEQEDYYFLSQIEEKNLRGWLVAIMDGHDGKDAAEFCAKKISRFFKLKQADQTEEALRVLIEKLHYGTTLFESGSTISVAVILESHKKISVAILGDSPVVVLDKNGELHISPEHNIRSNPAEREAVEKRGGICKDGYVFADKDGDGIQLSRILGDAHLSRIVSREPDVYTISDPEWVLLASDGVFDPGHESGFGDLKEIKKLAFSRATAKDIMQWAESRELKDNATALVWNKPTLPQQFRSLISRIFQN